MHAERIPGIECLISASLHLLNRLAGEDLLCRDEIFSYAREFYVRHVFSNDLKHMCTWKHDGHVEIKFIERLLRS